MHRHCGSSTLGVPSGRSRTESSRRGAPRLQIYIESYVRQSVMMITPVLRVFGSKVLRDRRLDPGY